MDAQQFLDHCAEPDARQPEQTGAQFGVEELARVDAHFAETGEVLAGRVQDRPLTLDQGTEFGHGADGGRVVEEDPGTATVDLDQVGPLGVPVARRAFGVERERSVTRGEHLE